MRPDPPGQQVDVPALHREDERGRQVFGRRQHAGPVGACRCLAQLHLTQGHREDGDTECERDTPSEARRSASSRDVHRAGRQQAQKRQQRQQEPSLRERPHQGQRGHAQRGEHECRLRPAQASTGDRDGHDRGEHHDDTDRLIGKQVGRHPVHVHHHVGRNRPHGVANQRHRTRDAEPASIREIIGLGREWPANAPVELDRLPRHEGRQQGDGAGGCLLPAAMQRQRKQHSGHERDAGGAKQRRGRENESQGDRPAGLRAAQARVSEQRRGDRQRTGPAQHQVWLRERDVEVLNERIQEERRDGAYRERRRRQWQLAAAQPPHEARRRAGDHGVEHGDGRAHGAQRPSQRPWHRQQQGEGRRIAHLERRADEVDRPVPVALCDGLPQYDVDSVVVEGADHELA